MSLLLTRVKLSRWIRPNPAPWLPEDDVPADCLADLACSECRLSVWAVDTERSNLERVVAAVSSTRENLQNFDYALIARADVEQVGLSIRQCPGKTADREADDTLHWDLVELSGAKLLELARAIFFRARQDRFLPKHIEGFVRRGVAEGKLAVGLLNPTLRTRLGL